MSLTAATIDRLKAQLLTSGLSQQNQPLFQVVNLLIDGVRQSLVVTDALTGGGGSGSTPSLGQSFVTTDNDQASLANSRQIVAGSGIGFNDNGKKLIISSAIPFPNDGEDGEGFVGPPGLQGIQGATGPVGSGAVTPYLFDTGASDEEIIPVPLVPSIILPTATWVNVPYVAGDFTAAAGTWTVDAGDVISFKYTVIGRVMIIEFAFNSTTYGGGPGNELRFKIPGGFVGKTTDVLSAIRANDNGVETVGYCGDVAAANYIRCWRGAFLNWDNTSVNNTTVQGACFIEI